MSGFDVGFLGHFRGFAKNPTSVFRRYH